MNIFGGIGLYIYGLIIIYVIYGVIMVKLRKHELSRLVKKARKSTCRYKVAAIGFDERNKFVGVSFNKHRFSKFGGSYHAEMNLMRRYGNKIKSIFVCRINCSGLKRMHPCPACLSKAIDLGISIYTINGRVS